MLKFRVIVITGTPGVGKTVVAETLAMRLNALCISLGNLVKDENLILGVDEERETLIADLKTLSKRVTSIINEASKDMIIEGHYATEVIPRSLVSYVFVLRRDPDDLIISLKERGYKEKKVMENAASEVLDVCLINALREYGAGIVDEIDVTHLNIEEVVDEVLSVIMGLKEHGVGVVNWLKILEGEGRLERILSQLSIF